MSNNKYLDQYLELYSKYVDNRVGVHNYHIRFINYVGINSWSELRRHLRAIPALEKEMLKVAKLAVVEQKALIKAEKLAGKQARPRRKIKRDVDISRGTS